MLGHGSKLKATGVAYVKTMSREESRASLASADSRIVGAAPDFNMASVPQVTG